MSVFHRPESGTIKVYFPVLFYETHVTSTALTAGYAALFWRQNSSSISSCLPATGCAGAIFLGQRPNGYYIQLTSRSVQVFSQQNMTAAVAVDMTSWNKLCDVFVIKHLQKMTTLRSDARKVVIARHWNCSMILNGHIVADNIRYEAAGFAGFARYGHPSSACNDAVFILNFNQHRDKSSSFHQLAAGSRFEVWKYNIVKTFTACFRNHYNNSVASAR
jgi:hypothetical protein